MADNDGFEIKPESIPSDSKDKDARKEEKSLFGDAARREGLKEEFHRLFIWAMRVAGISVITLFIVRVWHLGAPSDLMWLNPQHIQL